MTEIKKSRARRKKQTDLNPAHGLIEALKFVAPAQRKVGAVGHQFCIINNHWVVATDNILTIGTKIEEDLSACPHSIQLLNALSKVGTDLSITQLSTMTLCIASGAFKGLVPCVDMEVLDIAPPDENVAVINDKVKDAIECVVGLTLETSPVAHYAAVLLQKDSAVGTNGKALLECWHGYDLPEMLIPKLSAQAIARTKKELVGFGYSGASATFWFDDGSFIKTQLFAEKYPDYRRILDVEGLNPWPVPEHFFTAIKTILPFTHNNRVYFKDGVIVSNRVETLASAYNIEGLPEDMGFNAEFLLQVEHAFIKAEFKKDKTGGKVYFFGEGSRGCIQALMID